MRSDRQELPEGFTKEDADQAEVQEAKTLAESRSRNARNSSATTAFAAAAPTDCMNYWPRPDLWVCGAIRVKYDSLGAAGSFLLWPTSNELVNPDNFGRRQTFQNGPIYWSAASGAHPVVNHFFAAWQRNGWEAGPLGYPTTDEIVNPDNFGRRQEFQNTAAIYWNANEAYAVRGAIRDKWNTVNAERPGSLLGYPISDEIVVAGGGRMNRFERGVLYWHPTFGAHPVTGAILDQWTAAGYEQSSFGYPTADQADVSGVALEQQFQNGKLYSPKPATEKYADYQLQSTGADQCPLPQASRVGAWVCGALGPSAPFEAPAPPQALSDPGTWCSGSGLGGCWTVHDDFKASYEVDLLYGRGPEYLGSGTALIVWQLAGPYTDILEARITSPDAPIGRVTFSGALYNGAAGVVGSQIHRTQPQFEDGPFMTNRPINLTNKSAMTLSDFKNDDHHYAVQVSVEFSEFPVGYFYFYARSPVSHYDDSVPDDVYRFMSADNLPGDREAADWNW